METDLRIRLAGRELHPIHENLFGQFLEKPSWGNETGPEAALVPGTSQLDPRVESLLQAMDVPVVRFPGGTDVDYLDWRDMVADAHGPGSGRPNSHARHQEPIVTNAFGYDEYGQLAGRLGWKTILVVNLRDGLLVADGHATLHRLRFLTRNEVRPGGAWSLAETDAVKVASAGMAVQAPRRSATVVAIPLQERQPHE